MRTTSRIPLTLGLLWSIETERARSSIARDDRCPRVKQDIRIQEQDVRPPPFPLGGRRTRIDPTGFHLQPLGYARPHATLPHTHTHTYIPGTRRGTHTPAVITERSRGKRLSVSEKISCHGEKVNFHSVLFVMSPARPL